MAENEPIIQLTDVTKTFIGPAGPIQRLNRVSLVVNRGQFVGICGPSGSGKSSSI